jgi:hypothetical protein
MGTDTTMVWALVFALQQYWDPIDPRTRDYVNGGFG